MKKYFYVGMVGLCVASLVAAVPSDSLFDAIDSGDLESLESCLQQGVDINDARDGHGNTALLCAVGAVGRGNDNAFDVVKFLLEHGADVNLPGENAQLALNEAVKAENFELTTLLINHGADINASDGYVTALMIAARDGALDIMELLISKGADIHARGFNGHTALSSAAQNLLATKLLIEHGAQVDIRAKVNLIPFLIAGDARYAEGFEKVRYLFENGVSAHVLAKRGFTILMAAASSRNNIDLLELLVARGVGVNARSSDGTTALLVATVTQNSEVVQFLVEHGARVNDQNWNGVSALMVAASLGDVKTAQYLIEHGAKINARNKDGMTALMLAASSDQHEVAELLLKHGAKIEMTNKKGYDVIMTARAHDSFRVTKVLLDHVAKSQVNNAHAPQKARATGKNDIRSQDDESNG